MKNKLMLGLVGLLLSGMSFADNYLVNLDLVSNGSTVCNSLYNLKSFEKGSANSLSFECSSIVDSNPIVEKLVTNSNTTTILKTERVISSGLKGTVDVVFADQGVINLDTDLNYYFDKNNKLVIKKNYFSKNGEIRDEIKLSDDVTLKLFLKKVK